ncbi:hypothetical protein R6Q59_002854 [Mikania micrantha]
MVFFRSLWQAKKNELRNRKQTLTYADWLTNEARVYFLDLLVNVLRAKKNELRNRKQTLTYAGCPKKKRRDKLNGRHVLVFASVLCFEG